MCVTVEYKFKHLVSWWLPRDIQLLLMDHLVTVDDLHYKFLCFSLVHLENFFDADIICLDEIFKFLLQVCELLGQFLVLDGVVSIRLL